MTQDMDWRHFVAYVLFIVAAFGWIEFRRGRHRAGTILGMLGFVVVLWLMIRFWR